MSKIAPQHRKATETSRLQWAFYGLCAVVTLAATVDPTWPRWQAVLMALWLVWIIASASWGLLPMNLALWVVYGRNHLKWRAA